MAPQCSALCIILFAFPFTSRVCHTNEFILAFIRSRSLPGACRRKFRWDTHGPFPTAISGAHDDLDATSPGERRQERTAWRRGPSHTAGVAMPKIASSRSACVPFRLDAVNMGARRPRRTLQQRRRTHMNGKQAHPNFLSHPSRPLETRSMGRACEREPFRSRRAALLRTSSTPTPTATCV